MSDHFTTACLLLIDASLRSLMVAVVVVAALRLWPSRDANLQHRAWAAVLVAMLLMPLLAQISPALSLLPSSVAWNARPVELPLVQTAVDLTAEQAMLDKHSATSVPPRDGRMSSTAGESAAESQTDRVAPNLAAAGAPTAPFKPAPAAEPLDTKPVDARPLDTVITWSAAAFIMYATIAALLLVRFLVAYLLAQRLAGRATPVALPAHCSARIRISDEILVPLTVGLVRPRILLPADWRSWDAALVDSVLAHEEAHIERRDYLVLLLGELNRALFWFHPLAWFLRRRLSVLAEQCCDDAVIASSASRRDYAQHLLTIARRLHVSPRRVAPLGISMARSSRVESRIAAILDAERPLARRLGRGAALALLAVVAPVILLAAGLRAAGEAPEQAAHTPAPGATADGVINKAATPANEPSNNDLAAKTVADSKDDPPSTPEVPAPPGASLQGHIVNESDGRKAVGAEIRLLTFNDQRNRYDVRTTTSDDAGNFTFENVASGDHRLLALLGDLASRATRYQGQKVTIDPQHPPTQPVVLRLSPAPSIQVHVQDRATGKPIADAVATLIWSDTGQDFRTDAQGSVLVRGLTPEVWHVRIEAAGYAAQVRPMNLSGDRRADATFQLAPGGRVHGVVKDETGRPVTRFGINVYSDDKVADTPEYTKSDTDGRYHFDFLPLNEDIKLRGWEDKYLNLDEHVTIRSDGSRDVERDLVLRRRPDGGSVKGIVTDRAGNPIAGAKLLNQGKSSSIVRRTTTNDAGHFTIDDVLEGGMGKQLIVKAAGFAPQQVTVRPGPRSAPAELTIKLEPGHKIRGQVVDTSGKPIAGASIYYARGDQYPDGGIGGRATADDQGRFAIDSLAPQTPFSFRATGFSPIADRIVPLDRDEEVKVTLQPEGVIRGRVVDATTGTPITRFKVRITFSPDRDPTGPNSGLSGPRAFDGEWFEAADGTFHLDDLVTGMPLQVTVETRQYGVVTLRRVVAATEADAKVVEFKLAPLDPATLVKVAGTITNERGQAMAYAELRLIVADKRPLARDEFPFNWQMIHNGQVEHVDNVWQFLKTRSDEQGRFHFDGVRTDGDIELAYWGDGVSEARLAGLEKLSHEERNDLHISCITPGEVRGVINRAKLAEATAVSASAQRRFFTEWFDEKEDDVAYALRNLPPGNYELQLYGERIPSRPPGTGFTPRIIERRPIVVESGKTLEIDFGYDAERPPPPVEKPKSDAEAKTPAPSPPKSDAPQPEEKKTAPEDQTNMTKATPDKENYEAQLTLHGTVKDAAGQPIGGALVSLPVQWTTSRPQEPLGASATCDDAGRFVLTIQRKWLTPAHSAPHWALWAYFPGHTLAGVGVYKQLFQGDESDIEVKLGPATDTAFRIIDPRGAPVQGAVVEPWHVNVPNYAYDIPPTEFRRATRGISDADGIARLPALDRQGFLRASVDAHGFGNQQQQLADSGDAPSLRTIRVRPTGQLEVRVTSTDPQAIRDLRIAVSTEAGQFSGQPAEHTDGQAIGYTDDKGFCLLPELAEGRAQISITVPDESPLLPREPKEFEIRSGQLNQVEIPLEPAVRVRGLARARGTDKPIANALIHVGFGVPRQGNRARTDAQGRFEIYVLPGPIYQQAIMYPDGLVQLGEPWAEKTEVPKTTQPFDLPPIEFAETTKVAGRLIDQRNKPLAGLRLNTLSGNRRYGFATTADDGSFTIDVPGDIELEYQVWPDRQGPIAAEIVERDPLVLRARVAADAPDGAR